GVTASRVANAPDASAPSFTADPGMAPLAVIQIDSPLGHSYDHPAPGTVPPFPTDSTLTWAQPLGSYFGSSVWIARTEDGSSCLLLAADAKSYGQCVPADLFARGSLRVTVAYSQLTADERPPALHPDQSIAYQWQPNEDLTIVIGRDASR
ncbi:MAG: hypothetical protein KKH75_02110, partial [Actinobacteria bacterium]|nr:hypothetical protein [Actinomycetota bacterium]